MTAPTLRDQLAKALRGKHASTDSRPSYRAADAVMPVVQAALVEQQHIAESLDVANDNLRALLTEQRQRAEDAVRQRDGFYADLKKAEQALAGIVQMCRTALIPPINAGAAVLARRILARIDQPEGTSRT